MLNIHVFPSLITKIELLDTLQDIANHKYLFDVHVQVVDM